MVVKSVEKYRQKKMKIAFWQWSDFPEFHMANIFVVVREM